MCWDEMVVITNNDFLPFCNSWQYKEHPDMDEGHQQDLIDEFTHHQFTKVQSSVNNDENKLQQQHYQEGIWNL